ncbi:GTP-binding protein [Streptomyces cinnamoneus]|uniref:GTP-binding protein n=1 Tax=Streptomyces cinnamoneus TaxID=53446 RepID=UPI0033EC9F76
MQSTIGVIGPAGSGKTTLAAAVAATVGRLRAWAPFDWADPASYASDVVTGRVQPACCILVLSAADGVTREAEEHVRLAREAGIPQVVVFVNKADLLDDPELRDVTWEEVRELLRRHGYARARMPVVFGSALKDEASVEELVAAVDGLPAPARDVDGLFLMSAQDVFAVSRHGAGVVPWAKELLGPLGPGTLVVGCIERGVAVPGQYVEIVGSVPARTARILGLVQPHERLERAGAGTHVGVLLDAGPQAGLARGQVLAEPGSVTAHTAFGGLVSFMTAEECDRPLVFPSTGPRVGQFHIRTESLSGDVTGLRRDGMDVENAAAGVHSVTVRLARPVALEEGLRFSVREGGQAVGSGVVTAILP